MLTECTRFIAVPLRKRSKRKQNSFHLWGRTARGKRQGIVRGNWEGTQAAFFVHWPCWVPGDFGHKCPLGRIIPFLGDSF